MKSGVEDQNSRSPRSITKGSAAKLKILSRKAGLGESGSQGKLGDISPGSPGKYPRSFRINPTKQMGISKIADSNPNLEPRKSLHRTDKILERQSSSSKLYFPDGHSHRRNSGFPSYMVANSPRK